MGRTTANSRAWLLIAATLVSIVLLRAPDANAQQGVRKEIYKVRLSPVPIDVSMMAAIAGYGSLTATLSGKQLTISGTFEGLKSPATTGHIHRGFKGIRGPVIPNLDLSVSHAAKGSVSGSLELTPDQIADLHAARLYVQIESERAPDGNVWGWILPQDNSR